MAKNEVEVIESIKKIDSELAELWSKKDMLETKRQEIIKENPVEILKIDLEIISKALENFNSINRTDYSHFTDVETYLNGLYHEIVAKIEEESDVDTFEVESVEVEA